MTVESALYPSQFNTNWPQASDMVSEGDNHIRLVKIVEKTTWANVSGAVTASHAELNYVTGVTSGIQSQLNGKGSTTGQTWTGAHVFSGSAAVPTLALSTSTTGAASTAFVQNEWASRMPNYTAPITASTTELNYSVGVTSGIQAQLISKGAIAGQAWTGTHDFTGATATAATQATGDSSTKLATTAFVAATGLAASLPGQAGNAGKSITTDGTTPSWAFVTYASLTGKPTTVSGYGITDAVTTAGAQTVGGDKSFTGRVLLTGGGGLGYGVGSGGTVTQATSKSTSVTLNKPTGQITMHNEALASGAQVAYTLTNSLVSAADTVVATIVNSSCSAGAYALWVSAGPGFFNVYLKNISAGSLSESLAFNYTVIKGAAS